MIIELPLSFVGEWLEGMRLAGAWAEVRESAGILDYSSFDRVLAVEEDGQIVGMVTFTVRQLVGFYVRPAYRRRGFGRSLLLAALAVCRQAGSTSVGSVGVEVCDQRALRLLESFPAEERKILTVSEVFRDE